MHVATSRAQGCIKHLGCNGLLLQQALAGGLGVFVVWQGRAALPGAALQGVCMPLPLYPSPSSTHRQFTGGSRFFFSALEWTLCAAVSSKPGLERARREACLVHPV